MEICEIEQKEYIELKKELKFEECKDRYTTLLEGSNGFLLDEDTIPLLHATEAKKQHLLKMYRKIRPDGVYRLALVCGYLYCIHIDTYRVKKLTSSSPGIIVQILKQ